MRATHHRHALGVDTLVAESEGGLGSGWWVVGGGVVSYKSRENGATDENAKH